MSRRGASKYGEDVIVGSPEYYKRMREARPAAIKLAQEKYRLKQKEAYAATKLAVEDNIPIEQALAEIKARSTALSAVISDLRTTSTVQEPAEEIGFIRDVAKMHNVSYAEAFEVMNDDNILNYDEEIERRKSVRASSVAE